MSKTVYLIGSLRNPAVPGVAEELRTMGHKVYDDWYGAGPKADDHWQEYEDGRKRNFRDALAGEAAQHIFNFDKKLIQASDAVLLVLPAGKSGHLEFGYARGIGKAAVILLDGEPERFDVMYNFASLVTTDLAEASAFIRDWKRPKTNDDTSRIIAELQAENHALKMAHKSASELIAGIHMATNPERK